MQKLQKLSYICPFCFEKQKISEIEFRCTNIRMDGTGSRLCPPKDDQILTDFLGFRDVQKKANFFQGEAKGIGITMPRKAECPECHEISTVRICPKCHSRLPNDIDTTDDLIFAIIGAKETGKSHYISVLIDIIKKNLSNSFNFALEAATEETIRRYNNDFKAPLDKGETIKATQSGLANRDVREPLIYVLRFEKKGFFSKKVKTATLIFFDTAGEDLNEEDTMLTVNKYIYNSSGIIFLLDPLQIGNVRDSLPSGTPLPQINTEIESIITRTTRMIRKAKNIKPSSKIDIPLAVVFTKIDALEPILEPSSYLNYTGRHAETGKFDVVDSENVSQEMESMLRDWSGSDFAQQVAVNFNIYSYFGLSALGCNPHSTQRIPKVVPHRVEDPFLWLLWKAGLIRADK